MRRVTKLSKTIEGAVLVLPDDVCKAAGLTDAGWMEIVVDRGRLIIEAVASGAEPLEERLANADLNRPDNLEPED